MRYQLLRPLEGQDALAHLFNQYLRGLSTPMTVAEPTYYTVAEVRRHNLKPKSKEGKCYHHCAQRYYELTILRQSLEDIHRHVLEAIALLESFFTTYQDNLLAFARDTRRKSIDEYGSDDPTDWYRDNEADEAEEWKITPKDDPESLKSYTLHAELGRFFGDESCGRGEYLGTSTANDFATTSLLVAKQSEFSFRKLAEQVLGATLVRVGDDGTTSPIPLADHIEQEMNEDIQAERLVWHFNLVLGFCQVIRERYDRLALTPDYLIGYSVLLDCLRKVRDVEFPESLSDDLLALPEK